MSETPLSTGQERYAGEVFPSGLWKVPTTRHYVTPKVAGEYERLGIPLEQDAHGIWIRGDFDLNALAETVGKGTLHKQGTNWAADLIVCTQDPQTGALGDVLVLGRKHAGSVASGAGGVALGE